jgi:hypothetical protein
MPTEENQQLLIVVYLPFLDQNKFNGSKFEELALINFLLSCTDPSITIQ